MSLSTIEKIGDLICEAVDFIKKEFGIENSVLNKAEDLCKTVLPDLEQLDTHAAEALAKGAYDVVNKIKNTLSSQ